MASNQIQPPEGFSIAGQEDNIQQEPSQASGFSPVEVPSGFSPVEVPSGFSFAEPSEQPQAEDIDRSWGEIGMDLVSSFGKGSNALLKTAGDLYGLATGEMENAATLQGEKGINFFEGLKSNKLRQLEAIRDKKIAKADGIVDKAGVAFWSTLSSPSLLSSFVVEQVPLMVPSGLTARAVGYGAKTAGLGVKAANLSAVSGAVASGAAIQSGDVGGAAYDELMNIDDKVWRLNPEVKMKMGLGATFEEAKEDIALKLSRNAAIASGLISVGTNLLPGSRAIERALAGVKMPGVSKLGAAIKGFAGEALQEMGEEGGGQIASNINVGKVDTEKDIYANLGETLGLSAVGGGFMGGAAGIISGGSTSETDRAKKREATNKIAGTLQTLDKEQDINSVLFKAEEILQNEIIQNEAKITARDAVKPQPKIQDEMEGFPKEAELAAEKITRQEELGLVPPTTEEAALAKSQTAEPFTKKTTEPIEIKSEQAAREEEIRLSTPPGFTIQNKILSGEEARTAQEIADDAALELQRTGGKVAKNEVLGKEPAAAETSPMPAPETAPATRNVEVINEPVENLKLSKDVKQIKSGADEKGVVEPLGGTFDPTGTGPLQVWVRKDGTQEVISGRHRLDLAQRSGTENVPVQKHYEAEGFDLKQAKSLDAVLNIREGQGKVSDYIDFIRTNKMSEKEADSQGILARNTGKQAFTIATKGSDLLVDAHGNGDVSDIAATKISEAAPNNEALQAVGVKAIADGKPIAVAENMVKAVSTMPAAQKQEGGGDLFGFDDSAIQEAEIIAKAASAKQADVQKTLSAIQGAARNPERAAKEGVDVKDPAAVKKRIAELTKLKDSWVNWPTNPEHVAELRNETSAELETVQEPKQTEYKATQAKDLTEFDKLINEAPAIVEQETEELTDEQLIKNEPDYAGRKFKAYKESLPVGESPTQKGYNSFIDDMYKKFDDTVKTLPEGTITNKKDFTQFIMGQTGNPVALKDIKLTRKITNEDGSVNIVQANAETILRQTRKKRDVANKLLRCIYG